MRDGTSVPGEEFYNPNKKGGSGAEPA